MRTYLILLLVFCVLTPAIAARINSPAPLAGEPVAEQDYLREVYDNWQIIEVTETNPDGSRTGTKGQMLLLQTGGNSFLEINSDGDTTWLGVQLTNTP